MRFWIALQCGHLSPTIVHCCYISAAWAYNEGDYLNKMLEIREADFGDAAQIAAVKRATWLDEDTQEALIQTVLSLANHRTHTVVCDGAVAGFVSGFLTETAMYELRWELDLLAVHPDFRGMSLAPMLIAANTDAGQRLGAATARGLVQVENVPSQRAFARAGYNLKDEPHNLYVMRSKMPYDDAPRPEDLHLIPVRTMNYQGLWMEGALSLEGIRYAQKLCEKQQLDLIGSVISQSQADNLQLVNDAGFLLVGQYQWWTLNFSET